MKLFFSENTLLKKNIRKKKSFRSKNFRSIKSVGLKKKVLNFDLS